MPHDSLRRAQVISADAGTGSIKVTLFGYTGGGIYDVSMTGRTVSSGVPAVGSTVWVYVADERSHEVVWMGGGSGGGGGGSGADEVWVGPTAPSPPTELWFDTDDIGKAGEGTAWNAAWGIVASAPSPSPVAAFTIPTTTTGTLVTAALVVTLTAGRRHRVVFHSRAVRPLVTPPTEDTINLRAELRNGSTYVSDCYWESTASFSALHAEWIIDGTGASMTLAVYVVANAMSVGAEMYVDAPFYVEDVGPITGAPVVAYPAPAWIDLTPYLANGWTQHVGYTPIGFRKEGDRVWLRGQITKSTSLANPAFILPAGYRVPSGIYEFAAEYYTTLGARAVMAVNGYTDGAFYMEALGNISLNNISFSVTP